MAATPTIAASANLSLAGRIAHLPFFVYGPRLNPIVVLHETDCEAGFRDLLHARLYVSRAVDSAAHQQCRTSVPVPADLEARKALIHDWFFEHRLAPVLSAVEGNVHCPNLSSAGPCEARHFMESACFQLVPAGWRRNDRLALHHHAELTPLAPRHRVGVARGLAAEVPRLIANLDASQPLHADIAFPAGNYDSHGVTVFRAQGFAIHRVDDQRVVEHLLDWNRARVRRAVGALEQHPFATRIDARFLEQRRSEDE